MKKFVFTIWLFTNSCLICFSQESVTANVSKVGNEVSIKANKNYVLLFEEPILGTITFNDKTFAKTRMNIDLLQDRILFLSENNSLIPIDNQNSVMFVNIGKDLFFNTSRGLIQIIANVNDIKLGISRKFKTKSAEITGAYGMSSSTASTTQYSSFFFDAQKSAPTLSELSINQKLELSYHEIFYLIKGDRYYVITGVKQFSKLFKIEKTELENYVSQQNLDLKNKDNLLKLYNYCNTK